MQAQINKLKEEKKINDFKKEESELALKNEIKYLVDKLIKAKDKLHLKIQERNNNSNNNNNSL